MNMKTKLCSLCLPALFVLVCAGSSAEYVVGWHKIAGGGGTSTNGQYTVGGTIGQHDAGATGSGGNYSITGGFWSFSAVQTPGAPLLTITPSNNQVIVSWPRSAIGWTLQTNENLGTTNWGDYSGAVVNNRTTKSVLTGNLFFRLKQ